MTLKWHLYCCSQREKMYMIYPDFNAQAVNEKNFLSGLWEHTSINRKKTKPAWKQAGTETQGAVGSWRRTVFSYYGVLTPVLNCPNCSFGTQTSASFWWICGQIDHSWYYGIFYNQARTRSTDKYNLQFNCHKCFVYFQNYVGPLLCKNRFILLYISD